MATQQSILSRILPPRAFTSTKRRNARDPSRARPGAGFRPRLIRRPNADSVPKNVRPGISARPSRAGERPKKCRRLRHFLRMTAEISWILTKCSLQRWASRHGWMRSSAMSERTSRRIARRTARPHGQARSSNSAPRLATRGAFGMVARRR